MQKGRLVWSCEASFECSFMNALNSTYGLYTPKNSVDKIPSHGSCLFFA